MELFRHRFGFLHHTAVSQASACDRVPAFAHALCRPWHLHGSHALPCRCVCVCFESVVRSVCFCASHCMSRGGIRRCHTKEADECGLLRAGSTDRLHREVWLISSSALSLSIHATRTILMERGSSCTYSGEVLSLSLFLPRKAAPRAAAPADAPTLTHFQSACRP